MNFAVALLLSGTVGFISLSYEIVWFRAISFTSGGSPAVFGILLGFYLAGLAIGAHLSRSFCQDATIRAYNPLQPLLVLVLVAADVSAFLVVPVFAWLSTRMPWLQLLPLVSIAAAMFGAPLPIISHLSIPPDTAAGERLGLVYFADIVGSAAGSLVTGYLLLDSLSTEQISIFLALLGLFPAATLLYSGRRSAIVSLARIAGLAVVGLIVTLTAPRLFSRLYARLLYKTSDRGESLADVVENRQGVIAVTKDLRVYGGGAYDGAISTDLLNDRNMIVRAYAAAALHRAPTNVLVVGLSTGAWAQVIANAPNVKRLTIVEINPGYLPLIRKYSPVRSLLANPKVTVVIDDGRRWLTRHPSARFDLIVQNTTEHWRANVTNLLSQEYMTLVRRHLQPGGIFYFNTTDSKDAYKTAFGAFPYGLRLINFAAVSDAPVRLDTTRWEAILREYRIDGHPVLDSAHQLDRSRLDSLVIFASSIDRAPEPGGLETRERMLSHLTTAGIITDDNMLPEWRDSFLR
jgi:spermidine synthase